MKASVCIATYNKAPALDRTLRSIGERPNDYEVIVVDDGSTDDTPRVCRKHGVRYKFRENPGYGNPAAARNVAYRMALGDVIIAQSDDVIHATPNTVNRLADMLRPGEFLIATVENVDANGRRYADPMGKGWGDQLPVYTSPQRPRPLFFLGALWRTDLYAVGGNDEDFTEPGFEDSWFADCLMNGLGLKPRYLDGIVGHHQAHPHTTDWEGIRRSQALYRRKTRNARRSGKWVSSGGIWK